MKIVLLLLFGALAVATGKFYRQRRARSLPRVSDESFLATYEPLRPGSEGDVLENRDYIAKILRIPPWSLSPLQRFEDLSKHFDFLGDFGQGWLFLDDIIRDLRWERRVSEDSDLPETIGDWIAEKLSGGAVAHRN